jgi:TonB-dependent starch-binding outer membrane protein SusC
MQFIDCCISPPRWRGVLTKTLMVMKLTAILLFVACMEVSAAGNAQTVTLSLRNSSLERVFKEVKKQTGYGFIYTREQLESTGNVNVEVKNASLEEVLDHCFSGQPVTYTIEDGYIIVKPRLVAPPKLIDTAGPGNKLGKIKLVGRIVEVTGEALAGASVTLRQARASRIGGRVGVCLSGRDNGCQRRVPDHEHREWNVYPGSHLHRL